MVEITVGKTFFELLFLPFLIGSLRAMLSIKKFRDARGFPKLSLPLFFLFPFLLYLLAGLANIKFGWARNFFYLLPIYFLLIFYGLKTTIGNRRYYGIISAVVLIVLLFTGIYYSMSWEEINLEREIVRYASGIDSDLVYVIGMRRLTKWPREYYAKKYGVKGKIIKSKRRLKFVGRSSKSKKIAIIWVLAENESIERNTRRLKRKGFEISKITRHVADVGPYLLVKRMLRRPSPRIVIYQ